MLMVSHSINYGKRAVFLNAIGSALAAIILIIIALLLVDKTLPPEAVPILSIIGSLYLIYIGYSSLRNKIFDTEVINKITKLMRFIIILIGSTIAISAIYKVLLNKY